MKKALSCIILISCLVLTAAGFCFGAAGDPVQEALRSPLGLLQKEFLSYFTPLTGSVRVTEDSAVSLDKGSGASVRQGMRMRAFKEGMPFIHPVTKERLGNVELPVGMIEISSVDAGASRGTIISGKPGDYAGAKAKIPATKVKTLFYQSAGDWYLGDAYYRSLQESGRVELIDTGLVNVSAAELLEEARKKGADVLLMLGSADSKDSVELTQHLFWASDGKSFSSAKTSVHKSVVKQLKYASGFFAPQEGEALLSYKLPFNAQRIGVGDFAGDGGSNIMLVDGNHVAIYKPGTDLKLLWEFDIPGINEALWIDVVDANGNGREEIIVTSASSVSGMADVSDSLARAASSGIKGVTSFIYELEGSTFKMLWRADGLFLRKVDGKIIAQAYSPRAGFEEGLFTIEFAKGAYSKGERFDLPKGTNIYDFQFTYSPDGRKAIFTWDENGFLHLYNEKGIRIWMTKEDFGGQLNAFRKESSTVMFEQGKWSVKDRILAYNAEVIVPKRKPIFGMVKGVGYGGSELRSLWWNGITVEERRFIEEMGGDIIDYTVAGDRILVVVKPFTMNQAKLILKGQNPFGSVLHVFSTKGR